MVVVAFPIAGDEEVEGKAGVAFGLTDGVF